MNKQSMGLKDLSTAFEGKRLKKMDLFSDDKIQAIFGHEAADDEDLVRLKEYYVKSNVYDRLTANLKLRILVGHKGIGKSAMFKIASNEDDANGTLSVLIKPSDISELSGQAKDDLDIIRKWTNGLKSIIYKLVLEKIGASGESTKTIKDAILAKGGRLLSYISDTITSDKFNFDPTKDFYRNLFNKTNAVNVYIDDLDRGWKGKDEDIAKISALMNAVRDISNEDDRVHFKIALRADVYYLFRTSDETTDKVGGSVIWLTWTNHEILALLAKRILTYFGNKISEDTLFTTQQYVLASHLNHFFDPNFEGEGHWANTPTYKVLMSLIRKRPRDLVKLCTLAAQQANANKHKKITTQDLEYVFPNYSNDRLLDTEVEYKSELQDIKRLLLGMKPSVKRRKATASYSFTTTELIDKIKSISSKLFFLARGNGQPATPEQLAQFLYKINFITGRRELQNGVIVRKYFEEHNYLMQEFVDFGFSWEVHPAYRWALQPDDPKDIFRRLEKLDFDE